MKGRVDWWITFLLVVMCGACAALHIGRLCMWLGMSAWGVRWDLDLGQIFGTVLVALLSSAATIWLSSLLLVDASVSKDKAQ